jgi:hypothetical protein
MAQQHQRLCTAHLQAPLHVFHQGNEPNFNSEHSKKVLTCGKKLPLFVALKEACHRARSLDMQVMEANWADLVKNMGHVHPIVIAKS